MRRKKLSTAGAVMAAASMLLSPAAMAKEDIIAVPHQQQEAWEELAVPNDDVVDTGVNIRSAASEDSRVIGYLYQGSAAWVLKQGEEWTEVYSGGLTGFVKNEYLVFGQTAKDMALGHGLEGVATTWEDVKVYSEGNETAEVVDSLDYGDSLILTQDYGHWLQVQRGADNVAYVSSEDVSRVLLLDAAVPTDAMRREMEGGSSEGSSAAPLSSPDSDGTSLTEDGNYDHNEAYPDSSNGSETYPDDSNGGEAYPDDNGSDGGDSWSDNGETEPYIPDDSYDDTWDGSEDGGDDYYDADADTVIDGSDDSSYDDGGDDYYDADSSSDGSSADGSWDGSDADGSDSSWDGSGADSTDSSSGDSGTADDSADGYITTGEDGSYYDPDTGIYYDASTGLYYDSGTGILYDAWWNPVNQDTATPSTEAPAETDAAQDTWTPEETDAPQDTWTPEETDAPQTDAPAATGSDDTSLLAALIYCEAGNQSYDGMVAVGAVVMNRVNSASFPNSISEVIYQSGQFTPAYSGSLASALANGVPSACYDAAVAAMNGENPIGNALYFNTGSGTGMKLGDHQFF